MTQTDILVVVEVFPTLNYCCTDSKKQGVTEEGRKSNNLQNFLLLCTAEKGLGSSRFLTGAMDGVVWQGWSNSEEGKLR